MKNLEQQVNLAKEQKVDNNWLSSEKRQRQTQKLVLANLT